MLDVAPDVETRWGGLRGCQTIHHPQPVMSAAPLEVEGSTVGRLGVGVWLPTSLAGLPSIHVCRTLALGFIASSLALLEPLGGWAM